MTFAVLVAIGLLSLCIVCSVAYFWLSRQQRNCQHKLQQLEQQLDYQAQQLQQSRHELEELRAGVIGVGQRVLQMDNRQLQLAEHVQALNDKQQALELTDPDAKIYSRAMKMVQLGAGLDEIMQECELPRAEAELLFNLHQTKT
uniref:ATPase involved in DNA repair n=1 Tax=Rheinheimera sp. BAL341 TaxID=1708203 RepID=A0A486XVK2_9GAMM